MCRFPASGSSWKSCDNCLIRCHDRRDNRRGFDRVFFGNVVDCPRHRTLPQLLSRYQNDLTVCQAPNVTRQRRSVQVKPGRRLAGSFAGTNASRYLPHIFSPDCESREPPPIGPYCCVKGVWGEVAERSHDRKLELQRESTPIDKIRQAQDFRPVDHRSCS